MRIEQSLHGYADGHRLLSASVELPRDARHVMLGLSDLSGRNMVEGFQEYLTGYPISGTGYFAFAKTWYASEMDRPGCVWTHTLLLRPEDLGLIRHLGSLCDLFRRPARKLSTGDYEATLQMATEAGDELPAIARTESATAVLWGLYQSSDVPVLIPADNASIYEALVLEIWSQQWPGLRVNFRFTTGAIAPRTIAGKSFDLQVVPATTIREVRRELPLATLVATPKPRDRQECTDWLSVAVTDLYGENDFRLRSFLWKLAGEIPSGRETFSPLTELFTFAPRLAEERLPVRDLIELVGERYPAADQGKELKRALFGSSAPLAANIASGATEGELLRMLATTRRGDAFDAHELGLEERARHLWSQDREEAVRVLDHLIRTDHNSVGERLLFALAQGLGPQDTAKFIESVPALAATIIRLNPNAAASPEVWRGPADRQWSLFDAATADKETPPELQRAIILAMLEANSDSVADGVARRFGTEMVPAILHWFDASSVSSPNQLAVRWRRSLSGQPARMLDWLASATEPREATVALVADLSNPHAREVHQRGPSAWLKPFRESGAGLDEVERIRLSTFFLALGFDNSGPGSDELVVRSFAVVHDALARDRLGYELWAWIEDHVPTLSWLRNWDRCERLRRGLAEKFATNGWPAPQFVRCAEDTDMLRDMLESCQKADGGKVLLRRLEESLSAGEFQSENERRKVLKKYV